MSANPDPIDEVRENWRTRGWEKAERGMAVAASVMRVQQLILAEVDRTLRPFGLTFARYELLMLLLFSRKGELSVGRAGEKLQVHPASVTSAVTRLEAAGLVERKANPIDGRGVLIAITPDGGRLAERATAVLNATVFESDPLVDCEAELYAPLKRLRAALGDRI